MSYAENALLLASRAVEFDLNGQKRASIYYYKEAVKLLELACLNEPNHPDAVSWCKKMHEYEDRAQSLQYHRK